MRRLKEKMGEYIRNSWLSPHVIRRSRFSEVVNSSIIPA